MSGLAGWIDFGVRPAERDPLDAMIGRLRPGETLTERRITGRGFAGAAIGRAATIGRHESGGDAAIVLGEAVHLPMRLLVDPLPDARRPDSHDPKVYDPILDAAKIAGLDLEKEAAVTAKPVATPAPSPTKAP